MSWSQNWSAATRRDNEENPCSLALAALEVL
jgi:hypothetical protein